MRTFSLLVFFILVLATGYVLPFITTADSYSTHLGIRG